MKNECSIVRDLLPLYAEGMLSEDSAAFVKEHLDTCEECCALSAGEEPSAPTDADTEQRTGEAGVLRTLKKKLRKHSWKKKWIAGCISTIWRNSPFRVPWLSFSTLAAYRMARSMRPPLKMRMSSSMALSGVNSSSASA